MPLRAARKPSEHESGRLLYPRAGRPLPQWLERIPLAMKLFVETVGWLGAIIMLIAYVLLTVGRLKSAAPSYHWLNIISGAGLICNSSWNGAYPSVFINAVWLVIGLYGVFSAGASARSTPPRATPAEVSDP
jgi:hypothetical protein